MALDCYDFRAGQPRHFPAGTYNEQTADMWGAEELDIMRLLWRCWNLFQFKKLDDYDDDDMKFVNWVAEEPVDDTRLNDWVIRQWQRQAH